LRKLTLHIILCEFSLMNGKTIIRKLEKSGFWCARVRGSHHIMTNGRIVCPVPVHGNKDIAIGTLKSIEKISGVILR